MERIIPCVMLIDDDRPTTVYNEIIIEESGYVKKIIIFNSAEEALLYLTTPFSEEKPNPNLILLDINMPGMSGWDFLEAYSQINEEQRKENTIVMLSTTADWQEYERAENDKNLKGIKGKPLTFESLEEIVDIYFNHLPISST